MQAGNNQSAQPQGQRITINGAWQALYVKSPTCAVPVCWDHGPANDIFCLKLLLWQLALCKHIVAHQSG